MIAKGLLSSKLLFYDLTNFFTYISTTNEKSELAQRGRNKQKCNDLKQFGLIQVATREFLIPMSVATLIDRLTEIKKAEIVTITSLKGKPKKQTQLEKMDPELQKLSHARKIIQV